MGRRDRKACRKRMDGWASSSSDMRVIMGSSNSEGCPSPAIGGRAMRISGPLEVAEIVHLDKFVLEGLVQVRGRQGQKVSYALDCPLVQGLDKVKVLG